MTDLWHFIRKCFIHLGFAEKMINWIMECITIVTFSVLVSGISSDSSRGIRMGTLCHLIFLLFAQNIWEDIFIQSHYPQNSISIKVAKDGPTIHFLMLADDCMMFCKASNTAAKNVKEILQDYYIRSD